MVIPQPDISHTNDGSGPEKTMCSKVPFTYEGNEDTQQLGGARSSLSPSFRWSPRERDTLQQVGAHSLIPPLCAKRLCSEDTWRCSLLSAVIVGSAKSVCRWKLRGTQTRLDWKVKGSILKVPSMMTRGCMVEANRRAKEAIIVRSTRWTRGGGWQSSSKRGSIEKWRVAFRTSEVWDGT